MQTVRFDDADTYRPEDGWRRVSMAGSDAASVEWFQKEPGHTSPMHAHENEQLCIVLTGEMTVHTQGESVTLGPFDSVCLAGGERHRVENTGDRMAVGLDVFSPGRPFDYWTED